MTHVDRATRTERRLSLGVMASLTAAIMMIAPLTASAGDDCTGKVDIVTARDDGYVHAGLSWVNGTGWLRICNLKEQHNGIHPVVCSTYAQVLKKAASHDTKVVVEQDGYNCSHSFTSSEAKSVTIERVTLK